MKYWIGIAVAFVFWGTLLPLVRGDVEGATRGFLGGFAVLIVVVAIAAIVWVARIPFREKN